MHLVTKRTESVISELLILVPPGNEERLILVSTVIDFVLSRVDFGLNMVESVQVDFGLKNNFGLNVVGVGGGGRSRKRKRSFTILVSTGLLLASRRVNLDISRPLNSGVK